MILDRRRAPLVIAAALFTLGVGVEIYLLFGQREASFRILGHEPYRVSLSDRQPVSQAFLMAGNGLKQVQVRIVSDAATAATLRWTLYRGSRDELPLNAVAVGEASLPLGTDRPVWVTLPFTRDGSSHDRWYTIEVQLVDVRATPAATPHVAIMATRDNPDRGGVLWVGDKRQPGSMMLRAGWESTTVYRRFVAEGVPHLPQPLREPIVQAMIAITLHWAFAVYVLGLLQASAGPVIDQ